MDFFFLKKKEREKKWFFFFFYMHKREEIVITLVILKVHAHLKFILNFDLILILIATLFLNKLKMNARLEL